MQPHRRQPTRLPCPWDSPSKNTGVSCHFLLQCTKVKSESEVAQSFLILSDPMDWSLPGSSIHGIFQAKENWRRVLGNRGQGYPRPITQPQRMLYIYISTQIDKPRACYGDSYFCLFMCLLFLCFHFYLFVLGYTGSSLLHRLFSSCGKCDNSSLWCASFSLWWLLLLQSMSSRIHRLQ